MPRRFVIDVDANVAGARASLSSLSNDITALRNQITTLTQLNVSQARNILGPGQTFGNGLDTGDAVLGRMRTTFQQIGNTIKQTSTIVKGGIETTLTQYAGNFDHITQALDRYRVQLEKAAPFERSAAKQIDALKVTVDGAALSFDKLAAAQYRVVNTGKGGFRIQDTQSGKFVQSSAEPIPGLPTSAVFRLQDAQKIYADYGKKTARFQLDAYADEVKRARIEVPPLPQNIGTIAKESPDLLRRLTQAGLGQGTTGSITGNLYEQGAAEGLRIQNDLVRGVTRVTGAFRDQNGVLKTINAEYDKAGGVVTRFGSNLSGVGQIFNQLSRNVQKVAEFAVATTAIYAAYRTIGESIQTINELDKSLRQFGITAGFSREESFKLFDQLSNVAIETATPLTEIVGAADDIALAVKNAGDSTDEYETKIISLTKSVGIFTNLTGIDTVKATDLLTSAYKQLGLQVDQIPGLLSKITAVAGGQSGAIADITTAVAQLGDAAKAGNLDTNELIATVKVLSQVTAKSPAEVATAVKNLIGSLASPGSIKELKAFGINLKDEVGNVRSIVDVYTEISEKIKQGVIPEGEVQAVIRAISGGPRRAPDAAALLSNIGTVGTETTKAVNASNEALIANAKILDSTQAKVTQLQAAFDTFAFKKFAQEFNDAIANIATILSKVLEFLNSIPTGWFEFAATVILLAGGVKIASGAFGLLFGSIGAVIRNLGLLDSVANSALGKFAQKLGLINVEAINADKEIRLLATDSARVGTTASGIIIPPGARTAGTAGVTGATGILGSITGAFNRAGGIRGVGVPVLGGVAASAALDVATGASLKDTVRNALLSAGIGGLLVPDPTISKVVAGIGFVGAALVSLIPDEKKATEATTENKEALLSAITAYQDQQRAIEDLKKKQTDLSGTIGQLTNKTQLTVQEQLNLSTAQSDYADNTLKLADANQSLTESFDKLGHSMASLPQYKIDIATGGGYNAADLNKVVQQLTEEILKASNPDFKGPGDFNFQVPKLGTQGSAFADVTARAINNALAGVNTELTKGINEQIYKGLSFLNLRGDTGATLQSGQAFDLQSLEADFASVTKLFDDSGNLTGKFNDLNRESIGLVQTAIEKGGKDFEKYLIGFNKFIEQVDAYSAILDHIQINTAFLQAQRNLNIISEDDYQRLSGYQQLLARAAFDAQHLKTPPQTGANAREDRVSPETYRDQFYNNLQSKLFDQNDQPIAQTRASAIEIGTEFFRAEGTLDDLIKKGALIPAIGKLFSDLHIPVSGFTKDELAAIENTDDLKDALDALDKSVANVANNLASKRLDLFSSFQAGDYKDNLSGFNALNQQGQALSTLNQELGDSFKQNTGSLGDFAAALTGVIGLERLAGANEDDFNQIIIDTATQAGLSAQQINALGTELEELIKLTTQDIPALKGVIANLPDGTDTENIARNSAAYQELAAAEARVEEIRKRIAADIGGGLGSSFGKKTQAEVDREKAANDALEAEQKRLESIKSGYESQFQSLIQARTDAENKLRTDVATPAGSGTGDTARKAAQIAQDQDALRIIDAEISANKRLRDSFLKLPDGTAPFEEALTHIHGLEYANTLGAGELSGALIDFVDSLGLTGKAAVEFINILIELHDITTSLDGLKSEITIQTNYVQTYTSIGEDPYFAGSPGPPRPGAKGPGDPTGLQAQYDALKKRYDDLVNRANNLIGSGSSYKPIIPGSSGSSAKNTLDVSNLDVGDPIYQATNRQAIIDEAIKRAKALQHKIPGEDKEAKDDVVALLHGTTFLENVKGVKEEYLRKAIEELTDVEKARLDFDTKADKIRRIRVGSGDFAAIANVPYNSATGVSVGGPDGPVNVNLNLSGQVLTPAQFDAMANKIAAIIKRSIANG